jgi:hypothetical protein
MVIRQKIDERMFCVVLEGYMDKESCLTFWDRAAAADHTRSCHHLRIQLWRSQKQVLQTLRTASFGAQIIGASLAVPQSRFQMLDRFEGFLRWYVQTHEATHAGRAREYVPLCYLFLAGNQWCSTAHNRHHQWVLGSLRTDRHRQPICLQRTGKMRRKPLGLTWQVQFPAADLVSPRAFHRHGRDGQHGPGEKNCMLAQLRKP